MRPYGAILAAGPGGLTIVAGSCDNHAMARGKPYEPDVDADILATLAPPAVRMAALADRTGRTPRVRAAGGKPGGTPPYEGRRDAVRER